MKKKPIAVIGGMGPEASAYFYTILIRQATDLFGAVNNEDFPEIVIYSIPVPDFISSNKKQQEALGILKERVKQLNKISPVSAAIACNTAHILLKNLEEISQFPFISIVNETVGMVKNDGYKTVGLLGTPSTIKSEIYQNAFNTIGVKTLMLNSDRDLSILEKIIRNVIAGKIKKQDKSILKKIADDLVTKGAQAIVLGCTELPLIFPKNYKKKVYNSLEILSRALLQKYYTQ